VQFRSIGPVFYFTHHVSDESHTAFPVVVSLELPISILASHASNSGGSSLSLYRLEGRESLWQMRCQLRLAPQLGDAPALFV
jgi:hypothetical protein